MPQTALPKRPIVPRFHGLRPVVMARLPCLEHIAPPHVRSPALLEHFAVPHVRSPTLLEHFAVPHVRSPILLEHFAPPHVRSPILLEQEGLSHLRRPFLLDPTTTPAFWCRCPALVPRQPQGEGTVPLATYSAEQEGQAARTRWEAVATRDCASVHRASLGPDKPQRRSAARVIEDKAAQAVAHAEAPGP